MGKVFSVLQRKINKFNIDSRAQKVISKAKPVPAPKHHSTSKQFEEIKKELSYLPKAASERDVSLHEKLKEVYVLSTDSHMLKQETGSSRPLPQERCAVETPEFGFQEPTTIPRGRCSLQQALKFISNYQEDPVRWKPEVIAEEYKLQPAIVEKIVHNYRMFQVYIPKVKDEKKKPAFVLPLVKAKKVEDTEVEQTTPKVPIDKK